MWSAQGVFARVLATRPIQEQIVRQANYLNRHYNSVDYDRRQDVTQELRTMIRGDRLTDERYEDLAEKYFRAGGSPAGWRTAVRNAIDRTEMSGREHLMDFLKDDSPINYMIRGMD